jgi:hypothetical protein
MGAFGCYDRRSITFRTALVANTDEARSKNRRIELKLTDIERLFGRR